MAIVDRDDVSLTWVTLDDAEWVVPYLGPHDRVIVNPHIPHGSGSLWESVDIGDVEQALRILRAPLSEADDPRLPRAPLEIAEGDFALVHFLSQDAFLTDVPSLYHLHDLQHAFYPQFFSVEAIGWRELAWRTFAREAAIIPVAAQHVIGDIAKVWPELESKCRVIQLFEMGVPAKRATSLEGHEWAVSDKCCEFLVYPASAWPHKNHVRLIEAFCQVEERDEHLKLVLTGFRPEDSPEVGEVIRRLGAEGSVICAGRLSEGDLEALYSRSMGVVLPSLYEAGSFPLVEAVTRGLRVALSDIPGHRCVLPKSVEWFDPTNVRSISKAISALIESDRIARPRPSFGINLASEHPVVGQRFLQVYREQALTGQRRGDRFR